MGTIPARGSVGRCLLLALALTVPAFLGTPTLAQSPNGVLAPGTPPPAVGRTLECHTGASLAAAFADASIQTALIPVDVGMSEADWEPYTTPVLLQRNLTILGTQEAMEDWPELDLAYLKAKVQLGPGTLLNFSRVVLVRSRNIPPFQPAGMDLLASSYDGSSPDAFEPVGRAGVVASWGAVNLWRTCLPPSHYDLLVRTWPRPEALPGLQLLDTSNASLTPRGCVPGAGPSARLVSRCYPATGVNVDVAINGLDTDAHDKTVPTGYLIWAVNFTYLCQTLMTEACVEQYGPAGCYVRTMAKMLDNPPPDGAAVAVAAPPPPTDGLAPPPGAVSDGLGGGGGGGTQAPLGPLLGGVLGGCCAFLLASVVALALMRRRRGWAPTRAPPAAAPPHKAKRGDNDTYDARGVTSLGTPLSHPSGALPGGGAAAGSVLLSLRIGAGGIQEGGAGGGGDGGGIRGVMDADKSIQLLFRESDADFLQSTLQDAPFPPDQGLADSFGGVGPHGQLSGASPPAGAPPLRFTPAELHLVPVTPLTPFAPGINLGISLVASGGGEDGGGGGGKGKGAAVSSSGGTSLTDTTFHTASQGTSASRSAATGSGGGGGLDAVAAAAAAAAARVELLPTVLGKGAFGRVVVGTYQGQRVAVKLLNAGLAVAAPVRRGASEAHGASTVAAETEAGGGARLVTGTAAATAAAATAAAPPAPALVAEAKSEAEAKKAGSKEEQEAPAAPAAEAAAPVQAAAAAQEAVAAAVVVDWYAVDSGATAALGTLAQEVEVLARCRHPNIVRLLAANLSPPRVCLVMELMDTSLDRMLHGARATDPRVGCLLPLPKVLHISLQVARALAYMHPTILHRDLKPANVLVSQPESAVPVVKIADFGLARLRSTVLITRHPAVGTAPYMAPEVFDLSNTTVTDKVDVWAFGIILWEMLSGERPWAGMEPVQIACAVSIKRARLPLEGLSLQRCPSRLRCLMLACWDAVPERRPAAADIVKALAMVHEAMDRPSADGQDRRGVVRL